MNRFLIKFIHNNSNKSIIYLNVNSFNNKKNASKMKLKYSCHQNALYLLKIFILTIFGQSKSYIITSNYLIYRHLNVDYFLGLKMV